MESDPRRAANSKGGYSYDKNRWLSLCKQTSSLWPVVMSLRFKVPVPQLYWTYTVNFHLSGSPFCAMLMPKFPFLLSHYLFSSVNDISWACVWPRGALSLTICVDVVGQGFEVLRVPYFLPIGVTRGWRLIKPVTSGHWWGLWCRFLSASQNHPTRSGQSIGACFPGGEKVEKNRASALHPESLSGCWVNVVADRRDRTSGWSLPEDRFSLIIDIVQ